jgi:hypothetical protein
MLVISYAELQTQDVVLTVSKLVDTPAEEKKTRRRGAKP